MPILSKLLAILSINSDCYNCFDCQNCYLINNNLAIMTIIAISTITLYPIAEQLTTALSTSSVPSFHAPLGLF